MPRMRILAGTLAVATVLAGGEARAQIAAINQQTVNSLAPALEEQRRLYDEWVFPEAKGYEDYGVEEKESTGGFAGDWTLNPYNPVNLQKSLQAQLDAVQAAKPRRILGGKARRKSGAKDPLALTQEGAVSGTFDITVDISTSNLGSGATSRNKKAGFSTKGLDLGGITGGGAPRLSIWGMDDDRKRMRRERKLVRENQLESDEEVLIREQQAEASGGTDFFEGF